jgi:hypothetical protein
VVGVLVVMSAACSHGSKPTSTTTDKALCSSWNKAIAATTVSNTQLVITTMNDVIQLAPSADDPLLRDAAKSTASAILATQQGGTATKSDVVQNAEKVTQRCKDLGLGPASSSP